MSRKASPGRRFILVPSSFWICDNVQVPWNKSTLSQNDHLKSKKPPALWLFSFDKLLKMAVGFL